MQQASCDIVSDGILFHTFESSVVAYRHTMLSWIEKKISTSLCDLPYVDAAEVEVQILQDSDDDTSAGR